MLLHPVRSNHDVKCLNCGQTGFVVWEESDGSSRQLVHVSRGFHPEIGRTRNGEPLIVCNDCDHVQG